MLTIYTVEYRHDLLKDFKLKYKHPQIACSVDMLDTGIDVPEIVNLVFLKPVKSKVKFWQMIGRGTRLCENLFGFDDHKKEFLILDFCQNFEFFEENPKGVEPIKQMSLAERIFRIRLNLAQALLVQEDEELKTLGEELLAYVHRQVVQVNAEKRTSFVVKPHLRMLDKYQEKEKWYNLTKTETYELLNSLAPLVFERSQDTSALSFDLMMLDFMTANINGERRQKNLTDKVIGISNRLKKQTSVPQVKSKLDTLNHITQDDYWKDMSVIGLEHIRTELRDLIKFLTEEARKIVTTSFDDNITSVTESPEIYETNSFDKEAYKDKVERYIRENLFDLTIDKIRKNIKITPADLEYLEEFLFEKGSLGSKTLFKEIYGDKPLGEFIRSVVGLDKLEAKNAFSKMVNFANLNSQQIQFMDLIIDYFEVNGVMDVNQLFNPPFSDVYSGGVIKLFDIELTKKLADTINEINDNCVA
ncbi:type I restriction-modification enzyme R subunit C-terminal domain-containing protein [Empedobacter sp. ULE_I136]